MASIGRVYGKQQDSHGNKGFILHSKLQKGTENRRKHKKKRKGRKATEFVERIKKV